MGANIKLRKSAGDRRKTDFLALTPGNHIIRILDPEAKDMFVHWMNNSSVACLNEDGSLEGPCPLCETNVQLMYEHRENKEFRNAKGWNPSRQMFFVNVLDRTNAKVCPNAECNAEVLDVVSANGKKEFPSHCPECGESLVNVEAKKLDKVKLLSRGVTLFNALNDIEDSILDDDGNKVGWCNYDIRLTVTGSGRDMKVNPVPLANKNDVVSVPSESLFELGATVVKLTAKEILDYQKGVQLRDIYQAREHRESAGEEAVENIAKEASENVQKIIKDLFPDED